MSWRTEVIAWSDLAAALASASAEGWVVVSINLHETGGSPVVYVVWSRNG